MEKYSRKAINHKEQSQELYIRSGECVNCGYCCQRLGHGDGFYPCGFLQIIDGKSHCTRYATRFKICRDYPFYPNPLNPKCGYTFEWIGGE